ncbi:hypothetical protein MHBO_003064 [Bonamia ostreae]|uniref:Uncharacterized protein n=1 Tax=Bonamia ostreae TaxID=126728 RepID=A0ABV2APD2_9EUKA
MSSKINKVEQTTKSEKINENPNVAKRVAVISFLLFCTAGTITGYLTNLFTSFVTGIVPVVKSIKLLQNYDTEKTKKILYYWIVYVLFTIIETNFDWKTRPFLVVNMAKICFFLLLMRDDFKYSEKFYRNTILPMYKKNEKRIIDFATILQEELENLREDISFFVREKIFSKKIAKTDLKEDEKTEKRKTVEKKGFLGIKRKSK